MILILTAGVVLGPLARPVRATRAATPAVNYVSADAVYVNVGRLDGLVRGARLTVVRDGIAVAVLEAVHVSSHSASCRVVESDSPPRVGDAVRYRRRKLPEPAPRTASRSDRRDRPAGIRRARRDDAPRANRSSGYVAFAHLWDQDMTGSTSSSIQPSVSGRLVVSHLLGTRWELRVRHRSRLYHRYGGSTTPDAWTHRLTEAALRYGDRDDDLRIGLGRMVVDDLYGLGFIDGGFFARPMGGRYRIGAAGGFAADASGGAFYTNRQKVGLWVTRRSEPRPGQDLELTAALAGSYESGFVSREFVYLQGVWSTPSGVYVYQSVEIDVNRRWRRAVNGSVVQFSNYLMSASVRPRTWFSADLSYDARQNHRDWHTRATPDTLFDEHVYSGFGGGVTMSAPRWARLRVAGGVRLRRGSGWTNRFTSVSLDTWGLLPRGHGITLRWSVSRTPTLRGTRPSLSWRFPVGRRIRATVGAGAYGFRSGPVTTRTEYVQASATWSFGGRYYLTGDARQSLGGDSDALQLYTEIGLNF